MFVEIHHAQLSKRLLSVVLRVVLPGFFVVMRGDTRIGTHKLHRLAGNGALGCGTDLCGARADALVRRLVPVVERALRFCFRVWVQPEHLAQPAGVSAGERRPKEGCAGP